MKITLRNEEIVNVFETLGYIDIHGSVKWKYLVSKNLRTLKPIVQALFEKSTFENEKMKEFETKRMKLHRDFTTDDQGKPITQVIDEKTGALQRTVPLAKQNDWMQAVEDLKEEYKETFEEMEAHQREMSKLMSDAVEIEIPGIPLSVVPDADNFRQRDFTALAPIFYEEEATTE